jgi:hypothetical protein
VAAIPRCAQRALASLHPARTRGRKTREIWNSDDLRTLKALIAETIHGRPYNRARFAQEHPDLFGAPETGQGENYSQ